MSIGLIGVLITAAITWTAWTLNRHNEHRLLSVQTRQAGAVLQSTILTISGPLDTALQIETATGGNRGQFRQYMSTYVGPGSLFASASLWEAGGAGPQALVSVGAAPALAPTSAAAQAFITAAFHRSTFVVTSVSAGNQQRIAYAVADPKDPRFAIYAERAIPANRRVAAESDPAFADLNFATYLGSTSNPQNLATTDVSPAKLPISGDTARDVIPFGDTVLILVASPSRQLGGALGLDLPWIFLAGGLLITVATALTAAQLVRRRRLAEQDALTISGLYDRLDGLYAEQRSIAETLQRALLPAHNPEIPELEIASRYVAGARGVDIGGDWYTLAPVGERHFSFVVGDVSGRGISAATIMAQLRFTIRAYLLEGHAPDVVLAMCSRQLDMTGDGHFATVVVGIGDLDSREITLANAGHFNPLLISGSVGEYVTASVGLPLGVAPCSYVPTSTVMPPGSALMLFTDGLVERRGENLDVGLERLAGLAAAAEPTLEALLHRVVKGLTGDGSEDDVAVLAFRWRN